ncbi:hypothetical protein ACGFX4_38220 [Kitasatospora sp. NPDC048365]|uniref:hypothetical protein n=1 Tax=Kitasatospora sp. NPDC048365 TaxID=3364050 RepID=UPI00371B067C
MAKSDPEAAATPDAVADADGSAGASDSALLPVTGCVWWLFLAGALEILLGRADLAHVGLGTSMVVAGFGLLRLERWAYWAGWAAVLGLAAVAFRTWPNAVLAALGLCFLLHPGTRRAAHFPPFAGSPFSPGIALCALALGTPSLALAFVVEHYGRNPRDPAFLLGGLLCGALVTVTAFAGLGVRRWVWAGDLLWIAGLLGLSAFWFTLARYDDLQGLAFCGINLLFAAAACAALFQRGVRKPVFGARTKRGVFAPPVLVGGSVLAAAAAATYLLPGRLGAPVLAYTVFGLVTGTVVGLVPGANPAERIAAFSVGLLLAAASYVARGGLLPYTGQWSAVVVGVLFVLVTAVAAAVRSRAWFVLLLLGVGTVYGVTEPLFQAAPSTYLATLRAGATGIFLGFSLGFTASGLLGLELVER